MGGTGCPVVPAWSRYKKISNIGAGSFGQVYVADGVREEGGKRGRHVVKRVHVADLADDELLAAINEVQVLSLLDHCNVVGYRDHFVDHEGYLNIVMEYCMLGDLSKHIDKKKEMSTFFTQEQIAFYAFQLLQGVKYIHSLEIIHRDLKPANIFLTNDTTLKIADFGISKLVNTSVAQSVVGTPFYIAPEVCENKPYANTADVWSAGCVLYELAALEKPFSGTNILAVVKKITDGKYAPLHKRYSKLSRMVKKMLTVDPAHRPTIAQLVTEYFTSVGANLDLSPNGISGDITVTYKEWAQKLGVKIPNSSKQRGVGSASSTAAHHRRRSVERKKNSTTGSGATNCCKMPEIEFHLLPSQKCLLLDEGGDDGRDEGRGGGTPPPLVKYKGSAPSRPVARSGRRPSNTDPGGGDEQPIRRSGSCSSSEFLVNRKNNRRKASASATPKPRKPKHKISKDKNSKTLTPPRSPAYVEQGGFSEQPSLRPRTNTNPCFARGGGARTVDGRHEEAVSDEGQSDTYSEEFERYDEDDAMLLGNVPQELKISDEEWDRIRLAIEIDQQTDQQAKKIKMKRNSVSK